MDRLGHLRADAAAVSDVLATAPLDAPVAPCPGWTLRDLVLHLGGVHRWATAIVASGDRQAAADEPVDDADLAPWFRDGADRLLDVLASADPTAPCWSFTSDRTAGFWLRRQALETVVHRWDAQRAVGEPDPIDPELAVDGIAEVVDLLLPRQLALGRAEPLPCAVQLCALEGGSWRVGEGTPVAELHGPAELLLLALWHRADPGDPRLHVTGDRAAAAELLRRPLAP